MFGVLHCTPYWQNFSYITVEVFVWKKNLLVCKIYQYYISNRGDVIQKSNHSSDTSNILFFTLLVTWNLIGFPEISGHIMQIHAKSAKGERRVYESHTRQAKCTWWYLKLPLFYRVLLVVHIDVSNSFGHFLKTLHGRSFGRGADAALNSQVHLTINWININVI